MMKNILLKLGWIPRKTKEELYGDLNPGDWVETPRSRGRLDCCLQSGNKIIAIVFEIDTYKTNAWWNKDAIKKYIGDPQQILRDYQGAKRFIKLIEIHSNETNYSYWRDHEVVGEGGF